MPFSQIRTFNQTSNGCSVAELLEWSYLSKNHSLGDETILCWKVLYFSVYNGPLCITHPLVG